LSEIRKKAPVYDHDPEAALSTEQNAHIAVNAEEYYRKMMGYDGKAWNLRDTHMMETLHRVMDFHGKDAKCIIWNIIHTLAIPAIRPCNNKGCSILGN
jgi:erythromycin esterase-like protein